MAKMEYVKISLERYEALKNQIDKLENRNCELFDLILNVEQVITSEVRDWADRKPTSLNSVKYASVCLDDLADALELNLENIRDRVLAEKKTADNAGYQE